MASKADTGKRGVLAIWNDCAPGREPEFEAWFQQEHLIERLAVRGFLFGRRFEAVSATPKFFTCYVTEAVDTLTSPPYLERLNDPTPLTTLVMSEIFRNMNRTICRREMQVGRYRGSVVATARFQHLPEPSDVASLIDPLANGPGVARAELWVADVPDGMATTEEERLRGGDRRIAACLIVETLRQAVAGNIAAELSGRFADAETGVYRLLCQTGDGEA
jgi:hypothetical protein